MISFVHNCHCIFRIADIEKEIVRRWLLRPFLFHNEKIISSSWLAFVASFLLPQIERSNNLRGSQKQLITNYTMIASCLMVIHNYFAKFHKTVCSFVIRQVNWRFQRVKRKMKIEAYLFSFGFGLHPL